MTVSIHEPTATKALHLMTIGGRTVSSPALLALHDPATGEVFGHAPDAAAEQLDAAVAAARQAQPEWAATPIHNRREALGAIAGTLMAHQDQLAALLTREQGKPLARAVEEVQLSAYWCAETAKLDLPDQTLVDDGTTLATLQHLPLGVVGAIVPWNFPLAMAIFKVAPALLAGNTVVLKPSPYTPLIMLRVGELLRGVLPDGVLNVISGGHALGPWMTEHTDINKISFTGATATGRQVMANAAPTLKRLTLELGGNDAAIVLDDVDVETIAPQLFWGAFANSGQFCLAIKRLYIHEKVYPRLAQALVQLAQQTLVGPGNGDGVLLGPIQNRAQHDRLRIMLNDSRARGHRFLCGGVLPAGPGYFFPVTLVDNPPEDSSVVQREAFGPLLPLLKFSDVDDAVRRANASPFGLSASVWSADTARALAVGRRLEAGTVWINEIHTLSPHKPMAGHKQSGLGVEFGVEGLREFTQPRVISMRRPTSVPAAP
ncbi:Acyl-CoA reductase [Roseateles sp. YR242]|uniref:aldehyde dehydrogenase family protein n=1 Tax=Roseateles sp. YR242 TaxID=1855305 RepID=UPI0008D70E30|nr:aldehyde dehydrogenase family protein [Roseateles sp. YR242]SEL22996.1 Acyl-CoA reductase [Roseateles sp. YR242]